MTTTSLGEISVQFNESEISWDGGAAGPNESDYSLPVAVSESASVNEKKTEIAKSSYALSYDDFSKLLDSRLASIENSISTNVTNKITSLMTTLIQREIKSAVMSLETEFTLTTDYLRKEQCDLKAEVEQAKKKVHMLEEDKEKLSTELARVNQRLQTMERISRSCNIEIQNVPEVQRENLMSLVSNLNKTLGMPIADSDVRSAKRVAKMNTSSDRPKNIIVTLPSEIHRDKLINAVKAFNKARATEHLNSSHLGVTGHKQNVYVVEHAAPEAKKLYADTRHVAKNLGYKFVWLKFDKVYVRKEEGSDIVHIQNRKDLEKLN